MTRRPVLPDLTRLRELPLIPLVYRLGYQPDPRDPKRWKRHDSILSINGRKFFDHQDQAGGYGAIDLVIHARSCSCHDAIRFLTDSTPERAPNVTPRPKLIIPRSHADHWPVVRNYLTSIRALPDPLLSRCRQLGLIFADSCRNAVFWCTDAQRQPSGAEVVGTRPRPDGSRFRALTRGSRKHRGSFWLAVDRSPPHTACLTESPIDTLSAWLLLPEWRTSEVVFVSTTGVTQRLPAWLQRWNLKRLLGAFDADDCGDRCAARFLRNYPNAQRLKPPGAKDWNELLQQQNSRL